MSDIDKNKIWTGTLNQKALEGKPVPNIGFYDTTLRDGEQSVGVIFDPDSKLEIAKLVDSIGVGRIEAGFPRVSADDRLAIQMIQKAGLNAEIWGFARAMPEDIAAVADLGMKYSVIESPISELKLKALGVSHEKMLDRISKAISFAVDNGIHVAFFGVDSTRADLDFFERVYKTAKDAGAKEFVIVDTLAVSSPEAVQFLVGKAKGWLGRDAVLHYHGHNDFGLGTACGIAAANAGASWVHGTIDGIGERAGNANLPEIALAMELLYGATTGIDFTKIRAASNRLREIAGYNLEPWKSVVGENLFIRETGAVAAQFHIPQAVEPYSSEILQTPRGIVLGKKSGVASLTVKADQLGLTIDEEALPSLLEKVKALAISNRRLLTDDEFKNLVAAKA